MGLSEINDGHMGQMRSRTVSNFDILNRFLSSCFSSKRIFETISLQLLSVESGTIGVGGEAKSRLEGRARQADH